MAKRLQKIDCSDSNVGAQLWAMGVAKDDIPQALKDYQLETHDLRRVKRAYNKIEREFQMWVENNPPLNDNDRITEFWDV